MIRTVLFGLLGLLLFSGCKTEEDCIDKDALVYDMPSEGDPGEQFKIFGNCTVLIDNVIVNGVQADWNINLVNKLVFTVPSNANLQGTIDVYARGSRIYNGAFTAKVAPQFTSFSSSSGTVGSFLTIYGKNFCANPTVTFPGAGSTAVSGSTCDYIIVQVPGGATDGPLTINTSYGSVVTTSFNVL